MQIKRIILSAIVVLLSLLPLSSVVNAQASGSGLSITPTLSEMTLTPGQSKEITLTLKNATVGSIIATGTVEDFVADGTTGNPKLLTAPGESSPNSIKNFVFQLDKIPLNPGVQQNVQVGIHIPEGTSPGAYYGVIIYKAVPVNSPASGPGKVALTASVGSIVLITVPGKINQQVQFNGIHIYLGGRDGSIFFSKPNKIGIEIRNLGNGFVKPFGNVEVRSMFNKSVADFQFNNPKQLGNILPNSTRIFTNSFSGVNQIGRYKVLASVSYGTGGDVLILQKTFWYIPAWLAIVVVLVIAGLLYLVFRAYRHYRYHNGRTTRRHS